MPTYASVTAVGDSFTAGGSGGVASYAETVAVNWSATLDNQGVNGACLQTVDSQYPIYTNYPNDIGNSEALILAFGFNDARYTGADTSVTVSNYTDLYRSYMRRAVVKYSAADIYIATPWYISDTGLASGGGPDFNGNTRPNFEAYVNAAIAVAQEFGCNYYDFYAAGIPATTVDNIHPDTAARDAIAAAFEVTITNPDTPSTSAPTNPADYTIRVPSGCVCYQVIGDTETLLPVGDNTVDAGTAELMWTDGGGYVHTSLSVSGTPADVALDVTPAENVGCTVNSATPESISLTTTTARCHYTYDWSSVAAGEIVFMQITAATSLRLIVRENSATALNGATNNTLFDQTFSGTVTIRAPRALTTQYFGFLQTSGTSGTFDVKFFKVRVGDQTKLNAIPAAVSNFVINDWAEASLDLTGESPSRNYYSFDYTAVAVSEPIVMDLNTLSPLRIIVVESADSALLTGVTTLYDGTVDGTVSLELERTTTAQYFGFITVTTGTFDISGFRVGAAPASSSGFFGGLSLSIGIGLNAVSFIVAAQPLEALTFNGNMLTFNGNTLEY